MRCVLWLFKERPGLDYCVCKNLTVTHRCVCEREEEEDADCCDLCSPQTPRRLNHRESSTSSCPTRGTTFSCRWATSSPPSSSWSSSSSSSSSSREGVKSKVWIVWWLVHLHWGFHSLIFFPLCLSEYYPRGSMRWEWQTTHTLSLSHPSPHTHTHSDVSLSHTHTQWQVQPESEQLRWVRDGRDWSQHVQRGGEKSRWESRTEIQSLKAAALLFKLDCLVTWTLTDCDGLDHWDATDMKLCAVVAVVVYLWLSPVWLSDFKNNLLKEKVHMNTQPKVIDLDKGKIIKKNRSTCTNSASH